MRCVYVTGGSGFLGRSVVTSLAANRSVDTVVSGDVCEPPADRAAPGALREFLDVTKAELVAEQFERYRPDTVVHLASISDPGEAETQDHAFAVDVLGSRHVLEAALACGVRRLVVCSSAAAYGYRPGRDAPVREDAELLTDDAFPHARHKYMVERMLEEARREHPELRQVVLRLGVVLGDDVDNGVTALFEARRLVRPRGSQAPFSFVWDTDVVACIVMAVFGAPAGVFNVSGDGAVTLEQAAGRMRKPVRVVPASLHRFWRPGRRRGGPVRDHERPEFLRDRPVLDNTALKRDFGYVPVYTSAEAFHAWCAVRGY